MTDKVEIAWAGSFYDDPAALTWTDVTDRAFPGVSAALGRESDLASTPQARRASVRLKSYDGALTPGNTASPYYPNVVAGVPIRMSKRDAAGVWHPVFYGLTDEFVPTLNGEVADYTVVSVQCVSAWAYLTAAGSRRTYADRVVGDLAPTLGESWMANDPAADSAVLFVAGGVIYPGKTYNSASWPNVFDTASDLQRWGLAWLRLDNTGTKAWATPGAGCPLDETGGSDNSGKVTGNNTTIVPQAWQVLDGGFAGDRAGGQVVVRADGTCGVSAAASLDATLGNFSRVQGFIGRPPTQLAPVGVCAPTSTAGWTATGGTVSLVAASTLAHLPRTTAYDPTTKVTSAPVLDGPANAISWAATLGSQALTSPVIPVTAGKFYGPLCVTTGALVFTVQWLNNVGAVLSFFTPAAPASGGASTAIYGRGGKCFVAPAGAVNAQLKWISDAAGVQTVTVGCVGFYEGEWTGQYDPSTAPANKVCLSPARWWPIGADAKVWAWTQWPDLPSGGGMTSGTAGQTRWLHAATDVTAWDDGALHLLGWNGYPGVAGKPVVWADNARVTTGWTASYPGANVGWDATHTTYNGSSVGGGFGFGTATGAGAAGRLDTTNPSKLVVPAALLGAQRHEIVPDDVTMDRAWSFFGGKKSLAGTVYATDTGGQLTRTLDQLGWPSALRDIAVGASTLPTTWADDGHLSDYSALIGDLTKAEYGWVDIGPDGKLRWLPRAWYGVGTATAVAHYTWRAPTMGKTAYSPPLDVRWDDKDTANSVVVTNGADSMTRSWQDLTAQRRGLRKLVVTLPGGATQPDIDAVLGILAVVHAPGPRIESLTLKAFGPDDPMLAAILARRTGDVVLVDLPQLPAPDLTVPMLITSIEHTSDGQTWTAKFGLGVCPIPATFTWVPPAFDGGSLSVAPDAILDGGTLSAAPDLTLDGGTF